MPQVEREPVRVSRYSTASPLLIGLLLLSLTVSACGLASRPRAPQLADGAEAQPESAQDQGIERVEYETRLTGEIEEPLRELLRRSSLLITLEDRPPVSLGGLERRAATDRERLRAALRSEGFYDSEVSYRIDAESRPVLVTLDVRTGPAYRISRYEIVYEDQVPEVDRPGVAGAVGVVPGTRARASEIVAAQRKLVGLLQERGYLFAEVKERRAVLEPSQETMSVTVTISPGPRVSFGELKIVGLTAVDEAYVRGIVPWRTGETYDVRRVEDFRRTLTATGLFDAVGITPARTAAEDGTVPLTLTLAERRHRSVGGGAGYSTSEGFSGYVFWEHRNLLGRDEDLRIELRGAEIEQRASALFGKPRFLRGDQTLLADVVFKREDTDAFEELSLRSGVAVERKLSDIWRVKLGVSAELSEITEKGDTRDFALLGLPSSAARDTRDNLLNPSKGTRLELSLTPYVGNPGAELAFLVASATGSAYVALDPGQRAILAGRARLGSILGEGRAEIPANKRFYAGGGGSVRGYEFQKVGPLDAGGDPTGGRSLVEVGVEARLRATESIGVVPFVDGGTVLANPDFTGGDTAELLWAAGLGLRYYTRVGPLRLDVAVPLNRRQGVDDALQFYISIGQAF